MAQMVERTCWCGKKFQARLADVKRGWAKSCCKAHAAWKREKAKGPAGLIEKDRRRAAMEDDLDWEGGGWDAHKDSF